MPSWYKRLLPSSIALVIYCMVALTFLAINASESVVDQIIDPGLQSTIQHDISSRFRELISTIFGASGTTAFIVTFLFWLIVAALVYTIVWAVAGFIRDILNEIQVSLVFVHPRSFAESKHWSGFAMHYAFRSAAFLLLIGYSALVVYVLWPAITAQFTYGIVVGGANAVFRHSLLAFVLSLFVIHVFILLLQLLMWRRSADYWRDYRG